ncbi:MAG: helicase, partial [Clostridia bacterium]|nr:helicase [Deltaproteobacteria bacterium]
MTEGRNAALAENKPGHIAYRLSRVEGRLAIKRVVVQGKREIPLDGLMGEAQQQDGIPQFIASQADRSIEALLGPANGAIPQNLMAKTLDALSTAADIQYGGRPMKVGTPAAGICVRVEECGLGFRMRLDQDPLINEVFQNGALRRGVKILAVTPHNLGERMFNQLRTGKIYERDEIGTLVSEILPKLERQIPVHLDTNKLPKRAMLRPRVLITTTEEDGDQLGLLADIVYGDPPRARVEGEGLALIGETTAPVRDLPAESKLARELAMTLELRPGEKRIFNEMKAITFATRLMHVPPEEVSILGDAHHRFFDVGILEPELNVTRNGDVDLWFEAVGRDGVKLGRGRGVDAAVLLRAWQNGASMVPLVDGGFARLPSDWLAKYGNRVRDFMAAREAMDSDGRKAPKEMRYALSASLLKALDKPVPPRFDRLRTIIEDFEGIPQTRLPKLGAGVKLRDYQRQGVNWLCFLRDAELGALLADDMGLGKTLQTLCVIKGRTIVVAPTSVLHNWRNELARFRPGLKVDLYHGPDRELNPKADVTLTTYAILRLDEEKLAAEEWDMAVLDEAQSIKNPTSQVAKAAFALNATFRVALTGTPVENRLEDLWAQFHFVNRGLLGGRQDFYERYVKPITQGDEEAGKRLRDRVRPFVLRRMKSEVAKELPPRTEMVLKCELNQVERDVYDAVKATTQKEVVQKIAAGASTLAVLE